MELSEPVLRSSTDSVHSDIGAYKSFTYLLVADPSPRTAESAVRTCSGVQRDIVASAGRVPGRPLKEVAEAAAAAVTSSPQGGDADARLMQLRLRAQLEACASETATAVACVRATDIRKKLSSAHTHIHCRCC